MNDDNSWIDYLSHVTINPNETILDYFGKL